MIELSAEKRRRERVREAAERAARPSRLEVQLERAREFQRLLDSGQVRNRAELARRFGISRARVTQVMALLEWEGPFPGNDRQITERSLRPALRSRTAF